MRRILDANVVTLLERRAGAIGGRAELRGRRRAVARLAAVVFAGSLVAGAVGGVGAA